MLADLLGSPRPAQLLFTSAAVDGLWFSISCIGKGGTLHGHCRLAPIPGQLTVCFRPAERLMLGVSMTPPTSQASSETEIRKIIEKWVESVRTKDTSGLTAHVAPDVISFDLINPLQYSGSAALKKRAHEWLSSFLGPISYQVQNLSITTGDDLAFCHSLNHVNGTNRKGMQVDMFWRATVCFRKLEGNWLVTHEHSSVPFDMNTGVASLDLKP